MLSCWKVSRHLFETLCQNYTMKLFVFSQTSPNQLQWVDGENVGEASNNQTTNWMDGQPDIGSVVA